MIYLVSKDKELFDNDDYKIITVEESIKLLSSLYIVGLDTETTGLSCHKDTLLSLQLGCSEFQVIIDCLTIDITLYKDYLESKNRVFVGHNLKFDIVWLYKYHIVPYNTYDTYLGEQILWNGYPLRITPETYLKIKCDRYEYDEKKKNYILSMSLKTISKLYLGIDRDKTIRGQIIWKGIKNLAVIHYCAEDVQYMEQLMNKQLEILKSRHQLNAVKLINKFNLVVAYMEYCGIKIDIEKWKLKMKRDEEELNKIKREMDKWLIANDPNSPYIFVDKQGDLFSGFNLDPQVSINWNSIKQVIPLFKKFGVNVSIVKDGETKESINADSLKKEKSKCSLVPLYIKYKEQVKLVGTYGNNVLKQIDPETGRLYTKYSTKGTDTLRISSGGKDGKTKYINMLNMPSDSLTRSCFIAEKGNKFISIDYSGQESFLTASIANDKAMLNELNYGEKDLHTLTAKKIYDYIPKDMSADEVKEKFHQERKDSKGYEFTMLYGGNWSTLVNRYNISKTRAKEVETSFMSGFPGLKAYQDWRRKDWKVKGYIDLNPKIGFRAYIYDYNYLKELDKKMNTIEYQVYYNSIKHNKESQTVRDNKEFYKRISDTDRQSINYVIQHTGALCQMTASIMFFNELRKRDWLFKVLLTVMPYDEENWEAPEPIAEEVADLLHKCMVKAGSIFCTKCKLDADISRNEDGTLPDHWVH